MKQTYRALFDEKDIIFDSIMDSMESSPNTECFGWHGYSGVFIIGHGQNECPVYFWTKYKENAIYFKLFAYDYDNQLRLQDWLKNFCEYENNLEKGNADNWNREYHWDFNYCNEADYALFATYEQEEY